MIEILEKIEHLVLISGVAAVSVALLLGYIFEHAYIKLSEER